MNELEDYPGKFYWQRGNSAFTLSKSQLDRVLNYVNRQKEHHQHRDFQQELRVLLAKHDVAFEEAYLWE